MANFLNATNVALSFLVLALLWALNHILNVYAESLKKRHASAADEQLEFLAKKATGLGWYFRWVAILLGPAAATPSVTSMQETPARVESNQPAQTPFEPSSAIAPATTQPQEIAVVEQSSRIDFGTLAARRTAGGMMLGEKAVFRADAMRCASDNRYRINPESEPLEVPTNGFSGCTSREPMLQLERIEGGFRVHMWEMSDVRVQTEPSERIANWILVADFADKRR
jgi:hypothetical protein